MHARGYKQRKGSSPRQYRAQISQARAVDERPEELRTRLAWQPPNLHVISIFYMDYEYALVVLSVIKKLFKHSNIQPFQNSAFEAIFSNFGSNLKSI